MENIFYQSSLKAFNFAKNIAKTLHAHSLTRYLFVGGTTFLLDFLLLYFLHGNLLVDLSIATTLAYWISILYNFLLNRFWTFRASERADLKRHLSRYLLLLGFNYIFTLLFVGLVSQVMYFAWAKILAVAIQICWTYVIYKKFIFSQKHHEKI